MSLGCTWRLFAECLWSVVLVKLHGPVAKDCTLKTVLWSYSLPQIELPVVVYLAHLPTVSGSIFHLQIVF